MSGIIWLVAAILVIAIVGKRRKQGRRGGLGSAAIGSMYDMLNQDKRNAVEIIVEERAGARDPEDRDGNLPDFSKPRPR
ncbi:MAG TPA: hypothetical protein VKH42_08050 [Vicinamibacterales bacterium]|nr:hypothetical protein [Vicinamibacterales bacterium]